MGVETAILLATAAIGAGTQIHGQQVQKRGQRRAEEQANMAAEAAEDAQRRSQTQQGQAPLQNFSRRRKNAQGFDPAAMAQLVGPAGADGGAAGLLGS